MKDYVYVASAALRTARSLQIWLGKCSAFVSTLPAKKTRKRRTAPKNLHK